MPLLEVLAIKGFPIAIKFIAPHLASWCHSFGIAGAMKLTYATSVATGGTLWVGEKVEALKDGIKAVEKKDINGIWNAIDKLKDISSIGDISSLSKSVEDYMAGKGDLKEVLNGFQELYDGVRDLQKNLKSPEQISVENIESTNSTLENLNNHQSDEINLNLEKKNEILEQPEKLEKLEPKQPEINQQEISIAQLEKETKEVESPSTCVESVNTLKYLNNEVRFGGTFTDDSLIIEKVDELNCGAVSLKINEVGDLLLEDNLTSLTQELEIDISSNSNIVEDLSGFLS